MCDIQGCSEFSLFDLGEEDSVEISRKKGYPVKKLCKSHHYFLAKSGKKKKVEHCCDPRRIHGSKAKSIYTVEEDFCQEIEALKSQDLKKIHIGDTLCKHCHSFIRNLILENTEEDSSMELISSQVSSNTGLTQDDNLKKINDVLNNYDIKTVLKNPSVSAVTHTSA